MKIRNIRLGFATNSSSSHSIVVINGGVSTSNSNEQDFGWDNFTLGSYKSKLEYLGQILKESFCRWNSLGSKEAALLASSWLGIDVDPNGYIDHQSMWVIPRDYKIDSYWGAGHMPSRELVEAMKCELHRKDIVILGGNDNSDGHPLADNDLAPAFAGFDRDYYRGECIVRHDETYDYWTMFDHTSGNKVRFNFTENSITRAEAPELVDIKITDKCTRNCKFCYQDSKVDGKHADMSVIREIIKTLHEVKVFEVALGGGEPTEHPEFIAILKSFNSVGIVPNFSTRNVKWVKDNIEELRDAGVGGIGISVDNVEDVKRVLFHLQDVNKLNSQGEHKPSIVLHHVVGVAPEKEFVEILELAQKVGYRPWGASGWANNPLLLLGYKTTGRGGQFVPHQFDVIKLLKNLKKEQGYNIGVDTAFIDQHKDELSKLTDPIYWTAGEGNFSFYMDAVNHKMGNSSYDPCLISLALGDEFKEIYALTPEERIIKEIV